MGRLAEQVSVSLPGDLLEWLDHRAKELGASRSGLLAQLLEERRRAEWEALFVEGCREYVGEMREAADQAYAAQSEIALAEPFADAG
jgi:metal-responsive CopG/Arc/MetJ family transcriptional regulator